MTAKNIRSLARDQRGLSTVEYTVLLVLIVALAVGTWQEFGTKIHDELQGAKQDISDGFDGK